MNQIHCDFSTTTKKIDAAIFKEAFDEAVEFMIEKETIEKEETTELANEMEKIQLNQEQPSSTTNDTNGDDTKKE